ncbi:hypothetical protein Pan14r_31080 [Crateriforma conspicua]|uniref:Uncharacterized protein n=1 Tax=Crateriforma conspicua TaxID=2527996 RepID=A0A5C5Y6D3_9PLAN|nr:hypothetical protein Mal65_45790 [Crateriforma conspicua]TWT70800.1 hypothetical protein Pan14r_31080 [Crateriforma conspicua]
MDYVNAWISCCRRIPPCDPRFYFVAGQSFAWRQVPRLIPPDDHVIETGRRPVRGRIFLFCYFIDRALLP